MVPVGLVVLKAGVKALDRDIVTEVVRRVRDELGRVAAFKSGDVVASSPERRSGKILGRSEERRGGEEGVSKGRYRWSPYQSQQKTQKPPTLLHSTIDSQNKLVP